MNLALLSSRFAVAALAAFALTAQAPTPMPAQPLPLPPGNGAWVVQVVLSGGALIHASSYYLDSTGQGRIEKVAPGQTVPATNWTISKSDLANVAAAVRASKPSGWQTFQRICCNKAYVDLKLVARAPDGTVQTQTAGWNKDQEYRESTAAATLAANVLRAFERVTGGGLTP